RWVFRIQTTAGLPHETEPRLEEMALEAATEFLLEAEGGTGHVPDFGPRGRKQIRDAEGWHAPAVRQDLGRSIRTLDAQERVEARQIRPVPAVSALRHPRAARHRHLSCNTVLLVRELSIVGIVQDRSRFQSKWPQARVCHGQVRSV